jgi:2,3-bisphosphoglycerate-independent phosphoglycerate mutase
MVLGEGAKATDAVQAVQDSYAKGTTDEFIEPTVLVDAQSEPVGLIRDRDAVIFFNFRPDRARQMTRAFCDPTLEGPPRELVPKGLRFIAMTFYAGDRGGGFLPRAPVESTPIEADGVDDHQRPRQRRGDG